MFTMPILAFYVARHLIFANRDEPDNWAGGVAIIVTNIIVAGYCYSAYVEDVEENKQKDGSMNNNDEDRPRVGIYKQRTD